MEAIPKTRTLTPLSLSHLCAEYLRDRFRFKLNARSSRSIAVATAPHVQPLMLPIPLASELDRIAFTLVEAFLSPVRIQWDVTRYAEKLPLRPANSGTKAALATEDSLNRRYPPRIDLAAEGPISRPCIIVDMHGVILAWHLPGILKDSRQRKMMEATEKLRPLMGKQQSGALWRGDPANFALGTESPPGVLNISPAWFQQGHDSVQVSPQVGAIFRTAAALDWLDHISESNTILSAILAVIHPELHDAGQETFDRLRQHPDIEHQDVLRRWTSVFNGVSVISNRYTPPHRDGNSRKQWYDLLASIGDYENCNMELPGLGLSLEYGPGTVVGLLGGTLKHEVPSFKGERACYAFWMRDRVHEWAGVPAHSWMTTDHYR